MLSLAWLIPITLALGAAGLGAYIWSVRSGQYDDLDAAAWRILGDEEAPGAGPRTADGRPTAGQALADHAPIRPAQDAREARSDGRHAGDRGEGGPR